MSILQLDAIVSGERRHSQPAEPEDFWQSLWFDIFKSSHCSLAVVPTGPEISALFVAQALVAVGRLHRANVHLINAEKAALAAVPAFIDSLERSNKSGEITIASVDCPVVHPAATPIIRASAASLLAVPLGDGSFRSAKKTIAMIGRSRVVGCIAVEERRPM